MLLDREDARKLADVIGKKMAQEPGKWRAIARKVGPKAGCSSPFGSGDNLPAPGEAAHALNFMHHAVRGIRPYPENDSCGAGCERTPQRDCEQYGDRCIAAGSFNPCECTKNNGFSGMVCGVCIAPDIFICGADPAVVFKCPSNFTCGNGATFGGCEVRYCQCGDGLCPNAPEDFDCSSFTCSGVEASSSFGCQRDRGWFHCESENSQFYCAVNHVCSNGGFDCNAAVFNCQGAFNCEATGSNDCFNSFTCFGEDVFGCPNRFNCDINFQCQPLEAYDPDSCTTFNCPHYVCPDGPYNP
jgi:hypothetical protein